jgi:hypothetical protein
LGCSDDGRRASRLVPLFWFIPLHRELARAEKATCMSLLPRTLDGRKGRKLRRHSAIQVAAAGRRT